MDSDSTKSTTVEKYFAKKDKKKKVVDKIVIEQSIDDDFLFFSENNVHEISVDIHKKKNPIIKRKNYYNKIKSNKSSSVFSSLYTTSQTEENSDDSNISIKEIDKEKQNKQLIKKVKTENLQLCIEIPTISPKNRNLQQLNKVYSYVFYNEVLNNKKIKWKVRLTKISGWVAIGICYKEVAKMKYSNKSINIQNPYNHGSFLVTSDNTLINCINYDQNNMYYKCSPSLKEGNIINCFFSSTQGELVVSHFDEYVCLSQIESSNKNFTLVPCAIVSDLSDIIEFENFK